MLTTFLQKKGENQTRLANQMIICPYHIIRTAKKNKTAQTHELSIFKY